MSSCNFEFCRYLIPIQRNRYFRSTARPLVIRSLWTPNDVVNVIIESGMVENVVIAVNYYSLMEILSTVRLFRLSSSFCDSVICCCLTVSWSTYYLILNFITSVTVYVGRIDKMNLTRCRWMGENLAQVMYVFEIANLTVEIASLP